ncbi:hypothetical protein FM038_008345 [Shewanella eurypsychrophilus]|uniref:Transporter n=2 Tax=Shewanellaceae TaxID=267890 RepID=A0ABX6V4Y3_9GAMM|nr:hypothetical protein FS418_09925 [Shewanella sp. YLB-09]QPG57448.1 hypothetical protein FM038_008345 [Shewanella eurypsychrophilus]
MKYLKYRVKAIVYLTLLLLFNVQGVNSMGLRSFVALPVDKSGYVVRFSYEGSVDGGRDTFITSAAYGLSRNNALLIGIPYTLSSTDGSGVGDLSAIYRLTVLQDDFYAGTSRLALLAGALVPGTNARDPAVQAGFVYTHFKNRHEFDIDLLYQAGVAQRPDSGRYDISWQYRLSPSARPDWGIVSELNLVTELNGRWNEVDKLTHQLTLGLQWVNPRWVIEGGFIQNISNNNNSTIILSTRFHF